jgi:hypothetical protein
MDVERGFRRLMIVISVFVLALGVWALVEGSEFGTVAAVVGVVLGGLWAAFFALRWIGRGFLGEPERAVRRPRIGWKAVKDWSVIGIIGAMVVYVAGVLLWGLWEGLQQLAVTWPTVLAALWEGLRHPTVPWHAVITGLLASRLVTWLRLTFGDRGAIMVGLGLAALVAFTLVSECQGWWIARRQRRAHQRLKAHYAACSACPQLAAADTADDGLDDDPQQDYCPAGQRLYAEWDRA